MPTVINIQRKVRLYGKPFQEFADDLTSEVPEASQHDFTVAFVSDRKMKELNSFFRGKKSTTDVLSFPYQADEFEAAGGSDFLGDIVVSVEQAQKQAVENGLTLEGEIKQLILHGLLHLCGYDHETDNGEMDARELELRQKLGI